MYVSPLEQCSMSLLPDDTERFWTEDVSTGIHYQINPESALTWHQARKSCQQQNAELLSITEAQEQAYIRGKRIENKTLKNAVMKLAASSSASAKKKAGFLGWFSSHQREDGLNCLSTPWGFLWRVGRKPLWEWNVPCQRCAPDGSSCTSCSLSQGEGFLCSPLCKGTHSWPGLWAGPQMHLFPLCFKD